MARTSRTADPATPAPGPGAAGARHPSGRPVFPFTALIGQERMKRALVLNAINPRLGGVLVRACRRSQGSARAVNAACSSWVGIVMSV